MDKAIPEAEMSQRPKPLVQAKHFKLEHAALMGEISAKGAPHLLAASAAPVVRERPRQLVAVQQQRLRAMQGGD